MADRSERLAIIVTAQDLASGKLGKVRSELAHMGTAGQLASLGLGSAMGAVNKGEQALGHLRNRLTSLAGPLGFGALIAGGLGVSGALTQGIEKVDAMGLAIEKLTTITSLNVHQASQLLAVGEKYGISNEQIVKSAGMAEKILGKLAEAHVKGAAAAKSATLQNLELEKTQIQSVGGKTTHINLLISEQKARDQLSASVANAADGTTKLAAIDQKYGLHLIDNKGKVVDYTTELNQLADMYLNKAIPAATKDYVASQLLGKSYLAMIPLLKLGSKGMAEAAAEADKMGLTLKTAQDVTNVHDFIAAQRQAKDALAGLEIQLGLLIMPDLTASLKTFTSFMADHQADVKAFFSDALHTAEGFASFVSGTVVPTFQAMATTAGAFWNSIPGPLRDFMVKGFVADRTIKFLFGMSPIHLVASLAEGAIGKGLGGALGGIFQRGSTPANPMFVADVTGGKGPLGALPGAASGLGLAGAAGVGVTAAIAVGAALILDKAINDKGGLDKIKGIALGTNIITYDPSFSGTRTMGGKGGGMTIVGTKPMGDSGGGSFASISDSLSGKAADDKVRVDYSRQTAYNTGSIASSMFSLHDALNKLIGGHGQEFLAAGDKGGQKTRDEAASKLVQLYQTSQAPSLDSMKTNLAHIAAEAGRHPTDTVLHSDMLTLQQLVASTTAAVQNISVPSFRDQRGGRDAGPSPRPYVPGRPGAYTPRPTEDRGAYVIQPHIAVTIGARTVTRAQTVDNRYSNQSGRGPTID